MIPELILLIAVAGVVDGRLVVRDVVPQALLAVGVGDDEPLRAMAQCAPPWCQKPIDPPPSLKRAICLSAAEGNICQSPRSG
ncbi:MAG: hypothetical protein CMJ18_17020 [Phycisphaeraceae bacterium]|nr:hypothetical protein [Phycisphaeraceae bacterium]